MNVLAPDKLYYRIGEVAALSRLKPSVIRYWETEFPLLSPSKSRSGQRLYSKKEVELVLQIKHLLYQEKLTIEGARKRLRASDHVINRSTEENETELLRRLLDDVRRELKQLKDLI